MKKPAPRLDSFDHEDYCNFQNMGPCGCPARILWRRAMKAAGHAATVLLVLFVAVGASAQSCDQQKGHAFTPCVPPETRVVPNASVPFNTPVRFGGEVRLGGTIHWIWLKAAPSPACTPAQATDRNAYQHACSRQIGEALYLTTRFRS